MKTYPVISELLQKLFEAEERRLAALIVRLNQQNKELRSVAVDGFLYSGDFYLPKDVSTMVLARGQSKTSLHPTLYPQMERFLKDKKQIELDQNLIGQTLRGLLKPCESEDDIRNALPECLVDCLPSLSRHGRYREPAYTIQSDERALRQYQKVLPLMEEYSSARLIY